MPEVTMHYRADRLHKTCSVCGVNLTRGAGDSWWLRNTWIEQRNDYRESGGCLPSANLVPCGRLPDEMLTREPSRSQRMREAGFTRRPSAKSLPSDE